MSDVITSTTDTDTSTPASSGAPASGSATDKPAASAKAVTENSTDSGSEQKEPKETEDNSEENDESGELAADQNDPAKKPQKSAEKRIKKLIGRATAAEQEIARLKSELERARTPKEAAATETKIEALASDRPRTESFATHEEYEDALHEWREARKEKKSEAKAKEKEEIEKISSTYKQGEKAAKEKYADYDEVVNECETEASNTVLNLLFSSENGSELAYHLAKNEDELERISKLSPVAAARALGKFEALHIKAPDESEPANKITNAPAPISTVGSKGSASAPRGIYDDNLPYDEFKKLREQKKG